MADVYKESNIEDTNLDNFEEDILKLKKMLVINKGTLIVFTRDNSFANFAAKLIDNLSNNVRSAIFSKEVIIDNNIKSNLNRCFDTLKESLTFRMVDYNLNAFLKGLAQLLDNWLEMIEVMGYMNEIGMEECEIINYKKDISKINGILDLSLSVEGIVKLTNDLIVEANRVLGATPTSYKVSEHFLKAIKEE